MPRLLPWRRSMLRVTGHQGGSQSFLAEKASFSQGGLCPSGFVTYLLIIILSGPFEGRSPFAGKGKVQSCVRKKSTAYGNESGHLGHEGVVTLPGLAR
eukprot:1866881-Amphidinium_carterae.1